MTKEFIISRLSIIGRILESISEWTGKATAWIVFSMVFLVSYDVTMRYFFRSGSVALQELEWHLFSLIFLMGAAYTLKHDDHVRLDLIYKSRFMNDIRRAWVNLLCSLILLIPFCLLIIESSWPFVSQSYLINETSPDPGGLSYRWILKASIPISFALILLQGIAESIKNLICILENKS
jgi:TRAP-type mannitol/chloroaromatic compound transport system permease small subunit